MALHNLRRSITVLTLSAAVTAQCGDVNAALEQLGDARRLAANLHLQFTKAADASNRAVMVSAEEASVAFAREAEQGAQAVQTEVEALRVLLQRLDYQPEIDLLNQFAAKFSDYDALDRRILDLAVQNTNVKAQQLAVGGAQAA